MLKCDTKLVGLGGFEPPTSPLSGVRSNQLSYRPNFLGPPEASIGRIHLTQVLTIDHGGSAFSNQLSYKLELAEI